MPKAKKSITKATPKPHFIIWSCDDEVLICKPADEKRMMKDCFDEGGRNRDDYDRREVFDGVAVIHSRLVVW